MMNTFFQLYNVRPPQEQKEDKEEE